jgi:hypothetical protein
MNSTPAKAHRVAATATIMGMLATRTCAHHYRRNPHSGIRHACAGGRRSAVAVARADPSVAHGCVMQMPRPDRADPGGPAAAAPSRLHTVERGLHSRFPQLRQNRSPRQTQGVDFHRSLAFRRPTAALRQERECEMR